MMALQEMAVLNKKTVGKLTNNRAYGHHREMAWLPFQKSAKTCENSRK